MHAKYSRDLHVERADEIEFCPATSARSRVAQGRRADSITIQWDFYLGRRVMDRDLFDRDGTPQIDFHDHQEAIGDGNSIIF